MPVPFWGLEVLLVAGAGMSRFTFWWPGKTKASGVIV